jgi:hypothetical protein
MGLINKQKKRITRLEAIERNKEIVKQRQQGEGLYVFKNRTQGTLFLSKPTATGKRTVEPNETWEGDDYYLKTMVPREAIVVSVLKQPNQPEENQAMNEEKLILDQPDKVTSEGKIEHVVAKNKPINENMPANPSQTEVLLTEDPLEGVEIVLND